MPAPQREGGVAPVDPARAELGEIDGHPHEQEVGDHRQDERGEHDVDEPHAGGDLGRGVGDADEDVHDHREGEGEEHGDGLAQQQDELLAGPHRHDAPPGREGRPIGVGGRRALGRAPGRVLRRAHAAAPRSARETASAKTSSSRIGPFRMSW